MISKPSTVDVTVEVSKSGTSPLSKEVIDLEVVIPFSNPVFDVVIVTVEATPVPNPVTVTMPALLITAVALGTESVTCHVKLAS